MKLLQFAQGALVFSQENEGFGAPDGCCGEGWLECKGFFVALKRLFGVAKKQGRCAQKFPGQLQSLWFCLNCNLQVLLRLLPIFLFKGDLTQQQACRTMHRILLDDLLENLFRARSISRFHERQALLHQLGNRLRDRMRRTHGQNSQ